MLHVENEIEKILKLEMSELFKKLSKNPVLDFEVELKEELFQKCTEAEILNQVQTKKILKFLYKFSCFMATMS